MYTIHCFVQPILHSDAVYASEYYLARYIYVCIVTITITIDHYFLIIYILILI